MKMFPYINAYIKNNYFLNVSLSWSLDFIVSPSVAVINTMIKGNLREEKDYLVYISML